MNVINDLRMYIFIIAGTIVALAIAGVALWFYFLRVKKVSADEESIDYDNFARKDAREYCKFDDIIRGAGNMGMIHLGNNTFIGGIEVQGYNFNAASADEKERTMFNAIAFFNVLESPIQMCQTVQAIDITKNIKRTHDDAERIEIELLSTQQELTSATENLKQLVANDELFQAERKRVDKLVRRMNSLEWQLSEAKELIYYMTRVSDASFNTKRSNQIIFSYTYSSDDDLETLSDEEIVLRAEQELTNQAGIYGSALQNAGCTWKILTADDIVNLLRRHLHPITCDNVRLDELLNSSYNSLYVTSESLEELERERRGDIEYENAMREYNEKLREKELLAQETYNRTIEQLEAEAAKVV